MKIKTIAYALLVTVGLASCTAESSAPNTIENATFSLEKKFNARSVVFEENSQLDSICGNAFSHSSITSIEIPNSTTYIGSLAFSGCLNLTSIEIPDNVTRIESCTFLDCSNLTSVEIPSSVASIGDWAFYRCSSLRTIKCHAENIPETEKDAFEECPSDMTIYVPESSVESYKVATPWNYYEII